MKAMQVGGKSNATGWGVYEESRRAGAIIATGAGSGTLGSVLAFVAVVSATVNVVGGFLVTDRMLGMFRKPKRPEDTK